MGHESSWIWINFPILSNYYSYHEMYLSKIIELILTTLDFVFALKTGSWVSTRKRKMVPDSHHESHSCTHSVSFICCNLTYEVNTQFEKYSTCMHTSHINSWITKFAILKTYWHDICISWTYFCFKTRILYIESWI